MLTKGLWDEFEFQLNNKWMGKYTRSNSEVALLLLASILLTPLAITIDIIVSPIQIIYFISYKIVRKLRKR